MVIDADGIVFVAEAHQRALIAGLRIEIRNVFGRDGLVASNPRLDAGGC